MEGAVVGAGGKRHVLHLEVAAGLEVIVGDLYGSGEVVEAAEHHAREDEVELVVPGPLLFDVVDLENEVRGDAASDGVSWELEQRGLEIDEGGGVQVGLDGTQINAGDLRA